MDQHSPFPTHPLEPTHIPQPESDSASLTRQLDALRDLATLGMDFCHDLHARRQQPAPGTRPTRQETAEALSLAQTFGTLVRSVRHLMALESSLRQARARTTEATAAARLQDARRELGTRLEPALKAAPANRASDLRYRLSTRLTDWDVEQDLTHHSVDAAVTRICRDFAIAPPATPPTTQPTTHCRSP